MARKNAFYVFTARPTGANSAVYWTRVKRKTNGFSPRKSSQQSSDDFLGNRSEFYTSCNTTYLSRVIYRHRRTDGASDRTAQHTENANGKRSRSGPGEGHTEQHDHTRCEQLHGPERQVNGGAQQYDSETKSVLFSYSYETRPNRNYKTHNPYWRTRCGGKVEGRVVVSVFEFFLFFLLFFQSRRVMC